MEINSLAGYLPVITDVVFIEFSSVLARCHCRGHRPLPGSHFDPLPRGLGFARRHISAPSVHEFAKLNFSSTH